MLRFKLQTLFVVVTIWALALFWFLEPEDVRNNPFLKDPIYTTITARPNGDLTSNLAMYSKGDYGILEFGKLRIAVKGQTFRGSLAGKQVRLTGHEKTNGYEAIGDGIKFVKKTDSKGTHFEFVGLSFKVVDGRMNLLGKSIQADGEPTLVLVRKGRVNTYSLR